jgi:hypothetical protein
VSEEEMKDSQTKISKMGFYERLLALDDSDFDMEA